MVLLAAVFVQLLWGRDPGVGTALPALAHSAMVAHADPAQAVQLCVCLKLRDPEALQNFIDGASDPRSLTYREFLTPDQLGEQFGRPAGEVQETVEFLEQEGFHVTLVAKDRLHILADGTVDQAERAFHTRVDRYHSLDPNENGHRDYIANSLPIRVPAGLANVVDHVIGLQTWSRCIPLTLLTPKLSSVLYNTAQIRREAAGYGQGRTLGISNWDGFNLNNTSLYISKYDLPIPTVGALSNIRVVTIGGGSESGQELGEGDIDPQMVIGQVPLANVIIYDGAGGGNTATDQQGLAVYLREEEDDAADIITESYTWSMAEDTAMEAHKIHQLMTAEGITYMAATGDDQSTEEQQYWYPDMDPEVLTVGGTSAQVKSSGERISEVVWQKGSGGWAQVNYPFNKLPNWQHGKGVPANINYRLNPDVSGHACGDYNTTYGAYYVYLNGTLRGGIYGTSLSTPTFAAGLAAAEQELIELGKLTHDRNNHYRLGRIQDLIYQQNGNREVWYDITTGNNGRLPNGYPSVAEPGWDFCTGWGVVNWHAFVMAYPNPR